MLQFYRNSLNFLERYSLKSNNEDPKLVKNSLIDLLKGVGNMISAAADDRSKEVMRSDSEVRGFLVEHKDSLQSINHKRGKIKVQICYFNGKSDGSVIIIFSGHHCCIGISG